MRLETIWAPNPYVLPGLNHAKKTQGVNKIIQVCEKFYGIDPGRITLKTRKMEYVTARQVAAFLMMNYVRLTSLKTGSILRVDHATILHGCKQVTARIEFNREFRDQFRDICYRLSIDGRTVNELINGNKISIVENSVKSK